jgi:membrane protease YdiL (CAAX protease family)
MCTPGEADTFVSITAHAFWYTWLINRTGSVLLCILLHGSYNTANGLLLMVPDYRLSANYPTLLALMTSVLIASVVLLILGTRGRLGRMTWDFAQE